MKRSFSHGTPSFSSQIVESKAGFACESRRPAGLVVNSSTACRIAPTGAHIFAILDDARHGRIAAGISEHLGATCFIVLGVVVEKGNTFAVVVIARLLAIRTTRLGVDH